MRIAEHDGVRNTRFPTDLTAPLAAPADPVDLEQEYDLSDLHIPLDEIHTLLPRDAIPSLVDPATQPLQDVEWLADDSRVVAVARGDEVIGIPLPILDWHEVANLEVDGEPLAVTYCPLCDSAAVFSRVVPLPGADDAEAERVVLEFGVSGALYNSNVLMYDRRDRGLWSQVAMGTVSGPLAGTQLTTWPVDIMTFRSFRKAHPQASLVSRETGHERDYGSSPYRRYFVNERLVVPVRGIGDALPRKTLGIGIATDSSAWFVPAEAIAERLELETDAGTVTLPKSAGRLAVVDKPATVRCIQTFYYAWSAFYPEATVVRSSPAPEAVDRDKRPR